jgi:SGNH hydrolase-like domain, acetyltransferase AlgX
LGRRPAARAYRRTRFTCTPESECATDDLPQRVKSTISNVSRRIEYIDLTPVFRAAAARGELIYRPDDIHWAPAGHRLAAEITMEVLASMRANDER